ncbi:uncharacterized protein K452DRAFT_33477 [Aplosporella prunicola CBS 121167]|uniref:Uncharacterized protein n=1 Tax=Aplosporella prunicola CBS 121167 TaxID=1176127 RepID=A0A6A6BEM8_9PEZI|nr:uncharacterized protein K452DRAFT_33477 [Aplosporella prunicola CBS 121167]KAF2141765.1 hypothetical protein K452DRAFT_33477 [Aplosporella prunicola CBS 121167]
MNPPLLIHTRTHTQTQTHTHAHSHTRTRTTLKKRHSTSATPSKTGDIATWRRPRSHTLRSVAYAPYRNYLPIYARLTSAEQPSFLPTTGGDNDGQAR